MMRQKIKLTLFLLALALIITSQTAYAVKDPSFCTDPDIPCCGVFYTQNPKPDINLNFTTSVNLYFSTLTQGNLKFPLIYSNGTYLPAYLVTMDPTFSLTPNLGPKLAYSYVFNAKTKKGTRLDVDQTCNIIVDTIKPNLTITPNKKFFTTIKESDPNLTFTLSFSERAKINTLTINGEPYLDFSMESYNITHSKKPAGMSRSKTAYLSDGVKDIHATGEDLAENKVEATARFEINANKELAISLKSPKYGKSPTNQFQYTIKTDNSASCEAYLDGQNISYGSGLAQNKLAPTDENTQHTGTLLIEDEEEGHILWVGCIDNYWKVISYKTFPLGVDTSAPVITEASAIPKEIVERPLELGPLSTDLYVVTDEDTICRYDLDSENYDSMTNLFDVNETFTKAHRIKVNISTIEAKDYVYHIACINKAELPTPKTDIKFHVDLNARFQITSLTKKYYNTTSIELFITTNKQASCTYSANFSATKNSSSSFDNDTGYEFIKQMSLPGQGNYTFYISCDAKRKIEKAKETVSFIIDTTKPEKPYVDDTSPLNETPEFHYSNKSLRVNYSSTPLPLSGIKKYVVQIVEKNSLDNVTGWKDNSDSLTWAKWIFIRGLELENLKTYVIQVKAVSRADLASNIGESDGVTIDLSKKPEYCSNNLTDAGFETDIDCGNSCDSCAAGKKCSTNNDCFSEYCKAGVCTQATCTDGIKNQQEGDVDCGGPCDTACADGRTCNEDEDCIDVSYCPSGICEYQPNHCLNRRIDAGEVDLNCGGTCSQKCKAGDACMANKDCISNDCDFGHCNDATCDDEKKNQDETDLNCGGKTCDACQAGESCIQHSDCASENCNQFLCDSLTLDEREERTIKTRKIIFFSIFFAILLSLIGGGGFYAYKKGYLDVANQYLKNFDWKTLKLKYPAMPKGRFFQQKTGMDEMKRRQAMDRARLDSEKKMQERRGFANHFGKEEPMQKSSQQPMNQTSQFQVKKQEKSDVFSDLGKIGNSKSNSSDSKKSLDELSKKSGSSTNDALSDLSKLTDETDKKKKIEKK